jgi:hypothetical protein
MSALDPNAPTLSRRLMLPLLWVVALGGVVCWAACGATVVTTGGSASTGDTSMGDTGNASTGSVSTGSSSSGAPCIGSTDCPFDGPPSQGSPCSPPGLCCPYTMCDHAGGENETDALCGDGGVWEVQ